MSIHISTDLDYESRDETIRKWMQQDRERLAALQAQLTATKTALEQTQAENAQLRGQVQTLRIDLETNQARSAFLEAELILRDATITAQKALIQQAATQVDQAVQQQTTPRKREGLRLNPSPTRKAAASASRPAAPIASSSRQPAVIPKVEIKIEEDLEVVACPGSDASQAYLSPLPHMRRQELQTFPDYVPAAEERVLFTRKFLSGQLGGNTQQLIVRIGQSQKPLAKAFGVNKFLVPNLKMNPWCPRSAGAHGYMFVGLGLESETFCEPEQLNLFLSVPSTRGNALEVAYLGVYEAARVEALSPAEWKTLAPSVQCAYVEVTAERAVTSGNKASKNQTERDGTSQSKISKTHIHAEYDAGKRTVPCVRLRCVGFNEALYGALAEARSPCQQSSPRKRARMDS